MDIFVGNRNRNPLRLLCVPLVSHRPSCLRGVLTLFAPTRPAVARRSLSWRLLLTVVTGRLDDASVGPLAWRDARIVWLYLSSHSSSFDSPVWRQASLLRSTVLPPPRPSPAPSTEIDATRGSRVQSATGNRACNIVPSLSLSFSLSRPFCSSHVAEEEEEEVFELRWEKKRGLFIATKISVYRLGRFREERKREIRWIRCEPISCRWWSFITRCITVVHCRSDLEMVGCAATRKIIQDGLYFYAGRTTNSVSKRWSLSKF